MRGVGRSIAAPAPAKLVDPQVIARPIAREREDSVVVTSVIIVLLVGLVALGSIRLSSTMRAGRSKSALTGTLGRVFVQQGTFRLLNRRFATWPELAERGATLGPRQRVIVSSASSSHWFLAVRDTTTGITCSRTGELFDDSPTSRAPNCGGLP
jgi:hypothetical protein